MSVGLVSQAVQCWHTKCFHSAGTALVLMLRCIRNAAPSCVMLDAGHTSHIGLLGLVAQKVYRPAAHLQDSLQRKRNTACQDGTQVVNARASSWHHWRCCRKGAASALRWDRQTSALGLIVGKSPA